MQTNQLIIQYKRLLEQQSASVDALLSELNDNSKPPFKIAKDNCCRIEWHSFINFRVIIPRDISKQINFSRFTWC